MKRLKGPELKLSELKVPPFLSDLYWDLRDRRLLPLVGLVVVAIVAVPILLGGKSDETAGTDRPAASSPTVASGGASASKLIAVKAAPGLRNYHKRLSHRSPNNPFKQRYTAPQLAGSGLGGELSSTSSTSTTTTESTTDMKSTTDDATVDAPPNDSGGAAPGHLTLFSFAADIKISRTETKEGGGKETSKPTVRQRVIPPAALPSAKTPLVTYMGINPTTKRPLLLVSDGVTSVFGDAKCLSGEATCQLLEVEVGLPLTFALDGGVRYKINILKIKAVTTGKY